MASPSGTLSGIKGILARQDKLWYGNHHSVGYIPNGQMLSVNVLNKRTTVLGLDANGLIWTGRLTGLYNERDTFQYNWGDRFPELKTRIVAMQFGERNIVWIVTPDSGLLKVKVENGSVLSVEVVNGSITHDIENIQSLFVQPGGRVWMATNSGVYGLDPEEWTVLHFDNHDGLADNDVNCVLYAADTLWAGTVAGLSFFPMSAVSGEQDFATFITAIQYQTGGNAVALNLLDSLLPEHKVVLPADAGMVTLNLAGLNYRSQGNLLYECITSREFPPLQWLTFYNLFQWISHGFKHSADTTMVEANSLNFGLSYPKGSYKVKVTAVTAQGGFSLQPDEWTILMLPNWYSTMWFDLIFWGAIAYGIWRIFHARIQYRKLTSAVSDFQLQALQSQINPHFVGNSINAIQQFFYPPNPRAASNYVEVFTRLLRRTIILSEKHFNTFDEELAYDKDYLQMINLRFGERFEYKISGAETVPGNIPFPSMLLQPILENATIHGLAPEGISRLVLAFVYEEGQLHCSVTDNGMGYNASRARVRSLDHKSKGLELLHKKVSAFNRLYDGVDLRLELSDLSDENPAANGTRVDISFNARKIKSGSKSLHHLKS